MVNVTRQESGCDGGNKWHGNLLRIDLRTKQSTQGLLRGCCGWGQIKTAPVAYDVVSFLPTQTSQIGLLLLEKEKPLGFPQGPLIRRCDVF